MIKVNLSDTHEQILAKATSLTLSLPQLLQLKDEFVAFIHFGRYFDGIRTAGAVTRLDALAKYHLLA